MTKRDVSTLLGIFVAYAYVKITLVAGACEKWAAAAPADSAVVAVHLAAMGDAAAGFAGSAAVVAAALERVAGGPAGGPGTRQPSAAPSGTVDAQ